MVVINNPYYWKIGTVLYNEAGLLDATYYNALFKRPPRFFTTGIIVAIEPKDTPVPAYIFEILTNDGEICRTDGEALLVAKIL